MAAQPRYVTDAADPPGRCCALDAVGDRCPKPARYRATWPEQGGTDETFVCAEHLAGVRRDRGDGVRVEEVRP